MLFSSAPLVSVIIPTYDRPDYLGAALASAVGQSYRNLEIIVHDNASPSDLRPVVERFADPRVRFFRNERNIGIRRNVSAALGKASGKYVAILGDDDVWRPTFLEKLVSPMEADEDVIVSFCDHDIIDDGGNVDIALSDALTKRFGRARLREGVYRPFEEIALVYRAICVFSGAVLRRDVMGAGDFPPELGMGMGLDIYMCYLAARTRKSCYYCAERLTHYRYHHGSTSSAIENTDVRLRNAEAAMFYWDQCVRDGALSRYRRYFEMKRALSALVVVSCLVRRGDRNEALDAFWRFFRHRIIRPRLLLYHPFYAVRLHRMHA